MKVFYSILFLIAFPLALFATENELLLKYKNVSPVNQGEHIAGVYDRFQPKDKEIALTLDACGGKNGSGVDMELLQYLIDNKIKATLFLNFRWIKNNLELFHEIAKNDNFEIANHGNEHRPLFVHIGVIYGISGTKTVEEAIAEINIAGNFIQELTGKKPRYFRSGTAFYDDVALSIANDLGYKVIGFSLSADEGATLDKKSIIKRMLNVKSGEIILAHMNRPKSATGKALIKVIPALQAKGFSFVLLDRVLR